MRQVQSVERLDRTKGVAAMFALGAILLALIALLAPRPDEVGAQNIGPTPGSCTPLDLALLVDDSGSVADVIANVKDGLQQIINDAKVVGAGNLRISVVSFATTVKVKVPFSLNNIAAAKAGVNALQSTSETNNMEAPEASDEAVNTAVNGLPASVRGGFQVGDFVPFRPEAEKIIVLTTDNGPAGFDDHYDPAVDGPQVAALTQVAASKGIRINTIFTPTSGSANPPDPVAYLRGLAHGTGGLYSEAGPFGEGTATAIQTAVNTCGQPAVLCKGKQASVRGGPGNDRLKGTKKRDVIAGLGGKDVIKGLGGNDLICAGKGNDKVIAGAGNDKVYGDKGKDKILGGKGKDKLFGAKGNDKLFGGPGNDRLVGGPGKDTLVGGPGKNVIKQ